MVIYHLDLTYPCADDNQAERIGVAMAESIRAEFTVTGYGIRRTVPVGPPATVPGRCRCTKRDAHCWPYEPTSGPLCNNCIERCDVTPSTIHGVCTTCGNATGCECGT